MGLFLFIVMISIDNIGVFRYPRQFFEIDLPNACREIYQGLQHLRSVLI